MNLPTVIRRSAARLRRSACEAMGIARYSRPALYEIDWRLERHIDVDAGVFVEAGANDGFRQSNTYYFEKLRNWSGLLIEPVPELAAECRRNRRSAVVEAALVSAGFSGQTVEINFAGLMSTVTGMLGDEAATAAHVETGVRVQQLQQSYSLRVPARTLSSILDEAQLKSDIDLLSLDVEGGELEALRGLDFTRHAPRFICVEARDRAGIEALLGERYAVAEVLTDFSEYRDLLYRRR